MEGRLGRRTALACGLAAVGVIAAAALSWRQIAVSNQLRQEAGIRLLELYLSLLDRGEINFKSILVGRYDEAMFGIDSAGKLSRLHTWEVPGWAVKGGGVSGKLELEADLLSRSRAIQEELSSIRFSSREVPGYPGAEFSFHRGGEAIPTGWLLNGREVPSNPYCLVRWPQRILAKRKAYEAQQEALLERG